MSSDPSLSIESGCDHVPTRFYAKGLDAWDLTAGPFAVTIRNVINRLVNGELQSALLTGPVGCGKSLAAAIVCNVIADPLWTRFYAADARADEITRERADLVAAWTGRRLALSRDDPAYWPENNEHQRALDLLGQRQGEASNDVKQAERAAEGQCPRWLAAPEVLARLRREMGTDKRSALDLVEDATSSRGLLVIDDVGVRSTEWSTTVITEVVAERYDAMRPTIVTSNLTPDELAAQGLERVVSRLADGGALITVGSANDYRMKLRKSVAS